MSVLTMHIIMDELALRRCVCRALCAITAVWREWHHIVCVCRSAEEEASKYLAEPDSGDELDVDDGASVDPREAAHFVDDVADAGPLVRRSALLEILSDSLFA